MINNDRIGYYRQNSLQKYYTFTTPTATFNNDNIVGESVSLRESLCSEEKLVFGSCEANEISFSTLDVEGLNQVGNKITCNTLPGNAVMGAQQVKLGDFIVTEDKLSSNRLSRQIKAVDGMYSILNTDVTDWYYGLDYPLTLKAFRDSFFDYIGYTQKDEVLVNDEMLVYKTIDSNQITGAAIIKPICEINGVFGKISRNYGDNKVFKYVSLKPYSKSALYPSEELYPSETLYPSGIAESEYHSFDTDNYFSVDYANYVSNENGLDKLIIRQEENDVGVTVGDGATFDNTYVIQGNFLTYGLNAEELTTVATNLYNKIKYVGYVPLTTVVRGNPCLEVGDAISVKVGDRILNTFILQRTLSGMISLKDTYTSRGVEKYHEEANGLNAQINQLRGKATKIQADVDGLSVEVIDLAEDVSAELELKVSRDDNDQVVSMINASANVISLKGNRIEIDSDNFKVSQNGTVQATGDFKTSVDDGWYSEIDANGIHSILNGTRGMSLWGTEGSIAQLTGYNGIQIVRGSTNEVIVNDTNDGFEIYENASVGGSLTSNSLDVTGIAKIGNDLSVKGSVYVYDFNEARNLEIYGNNGYFVFEGGLWTSYNLYVGGSKNRVVKTEHYGARCINAFETPYAQFGDNGSAEIGANGTCKIEFEKIFAETIDLSKGYQVSITQTSEKATKWVEKKDDCFIVHGEPGATFDWFVVARQKDYADVRLEKIEIPNVESEVTE